ncbi:hypothetical protein G6F42_014466 [Rhizopus arrhizus]|nr:hypothetical protein G6F42_014466 [Rhizopus arrhizus]
MDNNSKEKNPTEIFKLFDKWAELLPKEGEQLQSGASFSRIGSEIKQQVSSMENQKVNNNNSDASTDSVVQETKAVKREVVSAPKENMKPNFLFELKSDDTNKSTEQQLSPFECLRID